MQSDPEEVAGLPDDVDVGPLVCVGVLGGGRGVAVDCGQIELTPGWGAPFVLMRHLGAP